MNKQNNKIFISVIVCTFNRGNILEYCLNSLSNQLTNSVNYEVIIIDNNSTDNTNLIIKNFIKKCSNFRTYTEKNQGLAFARNTGFKKAFGNYIAYIDDDSIAPNNWIEEIISFIKRHPNVKVFGGGYKGYSLEENIGWLPENYCNNYLGENERVLNIGEEWITGTNMIFDKNVLEFYGGFNTLLGMKGYKTNYGEETELLLKMHKDGIEVYYCPKITVFHLIPNYKTKMSFLLKSDYYRAKSSVFIFRPNTNLLPLRGLILRLPIKIITGLRFFVEKKEVPAKGRFYKYFKEIISLIGRYKGSQEYKKLSKSA